MKMVSAVLALVISATLALPAAAQGKPSDRTPDVPKEHRPPPGMCRIWIDGVPPSKQPASTDCATAVRNRPSNGRVIFGDDYVKADRRKPPSLIKGFTGGATDALEKIKRPDSSKPFVKPKKKP